MSLKVEQAFIDSFVNTHEAFDLPVAYENEEYTPAVETPYAEVHVIQSSKDQLTSHTDETVGLYRIVLRYPLSSGAILVKTKAEAIVAAYPINSKIEYEGQKVTITSVGRSRAVADGGWFETTITLSFAAYITR